MKRFLLLSFGLLISATLGLKWGEVTFAVSRSEDLLQTLLNEENITVTNSKDPKELRALASNEELPFQNLYLFMFQNVSDGPSEAALEELQTRLSIEAYRNYTNNELEQIVVEGNLKPIIEKLDSDSREEILEEYTYLVDLYQNELELQREFRKFAYEAVADEMFFNNDLNDSANIDILHDLDLAHYVLFGSVIEYPDRSGEEAVDLASEQNPELTEPVVTLSSDAISPYTCFDDVALREALEVYYEANPESEEEREGSQGGTNSSSGGDVNEAAEAEQAEDILDDLDEFIADLQGTPGDWSRSLPCNEIFCITVDLVSDTEDPVSENNYEPTSNCVLCHLSYINQRMEETLSKSLVANKPSQNWFEDATCKEAGSQVDLDFNVYLVPMPIELDPGDDIEERPTERIAELQEALISLGHFAPRKSAFDRATEDLECESILHLYDAADSAVSIEKIQEACVVAAADAQAQVDEVFEKLNFEARAENQNMLYEQASAELYTMLLLFQNIQAGFQQSYLTDDAPLAHLMSKNYCK
ncbi:hypothetical protein IPG41_06245 [Candidatus Peregrinibacteria bacterium]|nr:MAG: hypothetical protein IPG41_06245 [Candidatus Peregrinibacteria bacterium]